MRTQCSFKRRRPATRQNQKGVVAILVGMTIVVMVGMVGLAIDLGQLFVSKTELQNAADACALAGVNAMPAGLESSESAATTVAQRHKVLFQDSAVGGQNSTVTVQYSESNVNGPYQSRFSFAANAKPSFVRCSVTRSSIGTYFIQVLNALPGVSIGQQSVSAFAIARTINSQMTCAIPVAVCSAGVTGLAKGDWIKALLDKNSGDFKDSGGNPSWIRWVDFSPSGGGASEVSGLITGPGQCALPTTGTDLVEAGVKASVAAAYNSRFGIYAGGVKTDEAPPDFSGFGYRANWVAGKNAYPDFASKRAANTAYQGDAAMDPSVETKGTIKDSTFLRTNGRDRRVASVPVVDCNEFASTKKASLQSWACVFLLHPISNTPAADMDMWIEYLGSASDPTTPCASNGLPGASSSGGTPVATLVR